MTRRQGKPQHKTNWVLFAILGFMIVLLFLDRCCSETNLRLGQGSYFEQNEGWRVATEESQWKEVTLPQQLEASVGERYYSSFTFSKENTAGSMMRIRASMQDVFVYLDGQLIFKSIKPENDLYEIPNASLWHFVNLPEDLDGKTLTMEWVAREEAFAGWINEVAFGEGDSLLYNLLETQISGIFLTLLLLIFGIIAIFAAFFMKNYRENQFLYLGLFALSTSVWVFSEAKLMQLITGNWFFVGGISYIVLALMPGFFLMFLKNGVLRRYQKYAMAMALFFFAECGVNLLLQVTGVASLFTTIKVNNAMMAAAALVVAGMLIWEGFKYKNADAKKILSYFSVFMIVVLLEVVQFFIGRYEYISAYSRLAVVMFFVMLGRDSLLNFNELVSKEKERIVLQKIAYMDILTGGKNRTAFERDAEQMVAENPDQNFRLVFLDINNLKAINDTFGHAQGDRLIKTCHQLLESSFGSYGEIYRLGGDEFACLMQQTEEDLYQEHLTALQEQLKGLKDWQPYPVEVAIGSDIYWADKNEGFRDFYHRVDQLMYKDKRKLKGS